MKLADLIVLLLEKYKNFELFINDLFNRMIGKIPMLSLLPLFSLMVGCSTPCADIAAPRVYVGFQTNSDQDIDLAQNFLDELFRYSNEENVFHIAHLKSDSAKTMHSNLLNRTGMNDIIVRIEEERAKSSDLSIISFFERMKSFASQNEDGRELHAYLVSSGTSDSEVLDAVQSIVSDVATNSEKGKLYIYLIGVSDNRDEMVKVLHPIRQTASSSSFDYEEWKLHVDSYNSHYCSSDA